MSTDIKIQSLDGAFSYLNHDVIFDSLGNLIMLSDNSKLIQDIQKILFTDINYFDSDYSTELSEMIGTNYGKNQTIAILAQRVTDSLVYLQFLQTQQSQYQQVLADETIQQIKTLNVDYLYELTNNDADTRTFTVQIVILTGANQTITITRNVNVI